MAKRKQRQKVLKMVVLGEAAVGKTLLCENIEHKRWRRPPVRYIPTSGPDFRIRKWEIEGETYQVQIWDIPANEKQEAVADGWFRSTDIMVFVYNMCKRETFEKLVHHLGRVQRMVESEGMKEIRWILVGTHKDARLITKNEDMVTDEEATTFANSLEALNLRISLSDEFNFEWHREIHDVIGDLFFAHFEIRISR